MSLKNVCRRLERAEFYSFWPIPCFLIIVSIAQIAMFTFHHEYYSAFFDDSHLNPWCSMHVVNPDRVWLEPWRFLMYGFVHNSWQHLIGNILTQLIVGLPLELSHSSWRVALVYLFGIVYGGLGRELVKDTDHVPLAGASAGVFALIAAHLSHLFLNWNDDTYIFRQSVNWDARRTYDNKPHKPPQALPADFARNVRYVRLILTLVVLIWELLKCQSSTPCKTYVSYWAHGFGALSGIIMGYICLRARHLRKGEKRLKHLFLLIACGLPLSYILITSIASNNQTSPIQCDLVHWKNYEKICQDACYLQKSDVLVPSSCNNTFTIHKFCYHGHITFNATKF